MATLAELIPLLDYPTFLAEKIRHLKMEESLNEEVDGFIFLYDHYNGDTQQIKNYLTQSKQKITQSTLPKIRCYLCDSHWYWFLLDITKNHKKLLQNLRRY